MKDDVEESLRNYVKAFESLLPDAVAAFYHLPYIFIATHGVSLIQDADAAHGLAKILIEHARAQDYRRTDMLDLEVQPLAENMATLTGIFVRFNSADQEIS